MVIEKCKEVVFEDVVLPRDEDGYCHEDVQANEDDVEEMEDN